MRRRPTNLSLVIYVGTRRLAALIAEKESGRARILRFTELRSPAGFQKGGVTEFDQALGSVGELLKRLGLGEEGVDLPTWVLISSGGLKMSRYSSAIHYPGYPRTVTHEEVRKVVEQTRGVAPLPLEDWILQVVPESFSVNDLSGVKNPLGLEAQRLGVVLEIFTAGYSSFRNLSRLFEALEFNLVGYFPKLLALPEGVLNTSEREGEALIVDFSDEVTHLILTREGEILRTKSLELGSRFLTSRIAENWQVGLRDAERLKERFGSLEERLEFGEELVPLVERNGRGNHSIKRSEFHQVFLKFGEELFGQMEREVRRLLSEEKIAYPHFIVTGGGAKLEGLLEFMSRRWAPSVRLGTPRQVEAPAEILMDPAWSGVAGLVHWLHRPGRSFSEGRPTATPLERTFSQLRDWLAAYF